MDRPPPVFLTLRPLVLAVLAAAAGAAGWGLTHLRFDFTPQKIFESDSAAYAELEAFSELFGRDDGVILVHVEADDVFRPEVVAYVRTLAERIAAVEGVAEVADPTRAPVVRPGQTLPSPLVPEAPDAAGLAEARALAASQPLVRGRLVAADGGAALVVARLEEGRQAYADLQPVVDAALRELETTPAPEGVEALPTGIPVARVRIVQALVRDQSLYFPLCGAIFCLLPWLIFRDRRAVAVPLGAVLLALVYLGGLLGATGEPVNIINNVLPVLVFVIGTSDAIHLVSRYRRELAAGRSRGPALWQTVRHLTVACLLTSVTTAVGFASLAVADISILRRFGIYAALGVLIAYAVTVVFVPLAFSYLSPVLSERSGRADRRVDRISAAAAERALRWRWPLLAGGLLLMGASLWLGRGVDVENNVFESLAEDHPIVRANRRVERDFGGIIPVSIAVRWLESSDVLDPAVLEYLAELQAALEAEGFAAFSLVDLLREVHAAQHAGDPAARRLPDTEPAARQALLGLAFGLEATGRQDLLRRVYRPDERILRIAAQAPDHGSRRLNAAFARLEERLAADAPRQAALGIQARLAGDGPVASRGIDALIGDLFASLLMAFAIIAPTMCLVLRSVRAGLVSMIPNVFPLVVTLGFMGLVGLDLRVTTVIVFSVALGLAVDDTIHFMVRFREEWEAPDAPTYEEAIRRTFRGTGGAIAITSVLLGLGFAVLLFSSFPITRQFALGLEITVLAAVVGDLFVLPACLLLFRPFRRPARGQVAGPSLAA